MTILKGTPYDHIAFCKGDNTGVTVNILHAELTLYNCSLFLLTAMIFDRLLKTLP